MNNTIACTALIAAGCLSTGAHAQQVTMYGLLDLGMAYTTNANAAGDSIVKMPSLTASLPSRIGFRGSEDLGGGMQALFALETGIGADTGTTGQGNRLFGRAAYVGLKNAYGQLMLGRQVNMTFLATARSDIIGPNIFSISSLDLYLPNARSDNAIGYLGVFKELTVGATYSFGRDASSAGGPAATGCAGEVPGNARACRQVTGMLAWDTRTWGASASYDQLRGGPGAANGLVRATDTDRHISLNGYAVLGQTKIGGGAIERRIDAASDSRLGLYYLGASWPVAARWPAVAPGRQGQPEGIQSGGAARHLLPVQAHGRPRLPGPHAEQGRCRHRPRCRRYRGRGAESVRRADGRAPRVLNGASPRRATVLP